MHVERGVRKEILAHTKTNPYAYPSVMVGTYGPVSIVLLSRSTRTVCSD